MGAPMTSSDAPELSDDLIEKLFGPEGLKYLRNKHTGGTSGKKGTRYEDQFAAFKIAEALANHANAGEDLPHIEEQALGFVDDLVVAAHAATRYFQCKNAVSVVWTGGAHPISEDFKCQIALAEALEKPGPRVELVVSDDKTAARLAQEIPSDIAEVASVVDFPYFGSINQLVMAHAPLREQLSVLTRKEKPALDDLEGVFGALLLGWIKVVGSSSVDAIAQAARQQSPQLLRTFPLTDGAEHVLQAFVDALAHIPGLRYSVKRGFFSWARGVYALSAKSDSNEAEQFRRLLGTVAMSRTYTQFADRDAEARQLVDAVASLDVSVPRYQEQMRLLGVHLGEGILPKLPADTHHDICVVCTVEDADFLARGLIESFESRGLGDRTRLLCLWNGKVRDSGVSISPVIRQYKENFDPHGTVFVIVKSIISGACVVKTNLTRALSSGEPSAVFVAAPVMLKDAGKRLASEFPPSVAERFQYVWFATDDDKEDENVRPGIGGSVYERLGLGGESEKNRYMPAIVKERSSKYAERTNAI
ncbi:hypothetical protein DFQ28_000531 [Apophysomyces sp. BC1034]|nr:hypothetical protein DFQ28_000531 [Apophysomyces sp. BC1034]